MAAHAGKYAMRRKALMSVYKFDDNTPITILRFQAQFKINCISNEDPDATSLRFVPIFMKDEPASSLMIRMTPHKDDETTHTLPKRDEW